MTIITVWWRGYEDDAGNVDFGGLKALTCNYCGYEESIFYPACWPDMEYVCRECVVAGDSDGDYDC